FPHDAYIYADRLLEMAGADLLLLGHTHVPYLIEVDDRRLANPGSVGQPRDGDPRASYMLIEVEEGEVSIHHRRVEYDIDEVAERMRQLGLPEFLASRLYYGY
ncbi:metallophosphoesterase, partial [Candidatus Bathyarchaeota archaeon]